MSVTDIGAWRQADETFARIQRQRGEFDVTLQGRNHMAPEEKDEVARWVADPTQSWLREWAGEREDGKDYCTYVLLRFGEMIRRICNHESVEIANDGVLKRLVCMRYFVLLEAYEITTDPGKSMAASALFYNEKDVALIPEEEEFSWCADSPWAIRHAVTSYPTDPRGFLRKVRSDIDDIRSDPSFAWCRDLRGLLLRAAVNHAKDPRKYLTNLVAEADAILSEEEFSWAKDNRYLVVQTCSLNKDPRSKLRQFRGSFEGVRSDPELDGFHDGIKLYASCQATDARAWLLEFASRRDVIREHPDCDWIKDNDFLVELLAKTYPVSWLAHARNARAEYDAIMADRRLAWCHANAGLVKDLVMRHPDYHRKLLDASSAAKGAFDVEDLNDILSDRRMSQERLGILKGTAHEQGEPR